MDGLPFLGVRGLAHAVEGRGNFDRGLVGHDLTEDLIVLDEVAWLHAPLDEFTFMDAFTEFWELEFHLPSPMGYNCL